MPVVCGVKDEAPCVLLDTLRTGAERGEREDIIPLGLCSVKSADMTEALLDLLPDDLLNLIKTVSHGRVIVRP